MSRIDSYKHEIIGLFGGLPVYHPLEDIPKPAADDPADDFGCRTDQLVIGGGPGEHPGLVLTDCPGAVANFVLHCGDFDLSTKQENMLGAKINAHTQLHFAGWGVDDYHNFFERCTQSSMFNPFDPEAEGTFEDWLHRDFGEFIYYAMPQLAPEIIALVRPLRTDAAHIQYNNIWLIPPNMPVHANGGNAFFKS